MRIVDATVLASLLVVGGCSRSAPPYALPSDIDPVELKARLAIPQVVKTEHATLSASPGRVAACTGWDRATSKVAWQTDVPSIRLEVSGSEGTARQLFAAGGSVGEATTGNWVGDGTRFFLIDAGSGSTLAELHINAVSCTH